MSDLTEDIFTPFGIPENPPPQRHSALLSRNKRRSAEAGLMFKLPQSTFLNIGAEYMHESENSTNGEGAVGAPTTPISKFSAARHNTAFYSELTATSPAGASWTLSARRDDNSDYDAFNTYRAGASLPVGRILTAARVDQHCVQCARLQPAETNALHDWQSRPQAGACSIVGSRHGADSGLWSPQVFRELLPPAFQRHDSVRARRTARLSQAVTRILPKQFRMDTRPS